MGLIIIVLIGMVVIWFQQHQEVERWYDVVRAWDKERAGAFARYQPLVRPEAMIEVHEPTAGDIVGHVFVVEGKARGIWYANGRFIIEVQSGNGVVLESKEVEGRGEWYFRGALPTFVFSETGIELKILPVRAGIDWRTIEFVPFSAQVVVPRYSGEARIVLKKANPSGFPEDDASVTIPVVIQ